eukprot:TRINITY_DN44_c0_g1_i2.p1 TRINITY_DN44_c0_g1~~TRINITY_DN44_c0_g1_i2.p1  ORF type:complete len:118 (-),score=19.28 TRINITY_DN44_c0_g1_i2:388-741(-)
MVIHRIHTNSIGRMSTSEQIPELRPNETYLKIVAVGDGGIGKTSLLMTFLNNEFPENYVPTIFDNYSTNIEVGEKVVVVSLWDTAGQEDYGMLSLFIILIAIQIVCGHCPTQIPMYF